LLFARKEMFNLSAGRQIFNVQIKKEILPQMMQIAQKRTCLFA
jgi:hypothetical protein